MFRLAHISDVHLGPLPDISYRELASKRMVGYVNWHRNRRHSMHDNIVGTIISDIKAHEANHLAVTGDLVNLALDAELEMARLWLETLGDPHDVSVVPGNHDAYVPGAFGKCCRSWQGWMSGDGQTALPGRDSFPYLRVRGKVALIGVTSARASAPFMATGYFKSGQASRLRSILDETRAAGLFRIIMIHHPPVRAAVPQHKRLLGIGRFQRVMRKHGAELVIHGHSHLPSLFYVQGPSDPIPVVGVAATGQAPGGSKPPAQWNMFEIGGRAKHWSLKLTRRGLTGLSHPPEILQSIDLMHAPVPMVETADAEG